MKKVATILTASALLSVGACSGGESQPKNVPDSVQTISPSVEKQQDAEARQLWHDGMIQFGTELGKRAVKLSISENNCVIFKAPEGTAVVKNPGVYTYGIGGANGPSVEFIVYEAKNSVAGKTAVFNGPYRYYQSASDVSPTIDAMRDIEVMADPRVGKFVVGSAIKSDETSAWIEGEGGLKISQTVMTDGSAEQLRTVTQELCGLAYGDNAQTLPSPD